MKKKAKKERLQPPFFSFLNFVCFDFQKRQKNMASWQFFSESLLFFAKLMEEELVKIQKSEFVT